MFVDRKSLRKNLAKTVGFYQSNDATLPTISPLLSSSPYDRYVNEVYGLLTTENIDQIQSNFSRYNYDAHVLANEYDQGDIVQDNGVVYEAIQNVPASTPLNDTAFWFVLDDFNQYLYQKIIQGIDKVMNFVFDHKKIRSKVKSIFENIALYDGLANYRDKIVNNDNFVGLRFRLKHDRDIVTVINKIGHQFSEAVSFNMYLYHSSQQTPIATIPINHTKANSSQWSNQVDLFVRYLSDDHGAGGYYFLGYAQSELGTAQALKMYQLSWDRGFSCNSCSQSASYWKNYSPWFQISGFEVKESEFTVGVDMFDPQDASYTIDNNYGLNLNLTTKCDLTPFFIQEDAILSEAIKNATGLAILEDMASNTRGTNARANQVKEEAKVQVVSVDGVSGTVKDRVHENLKGLSFDLSGLQSECLPCDDGNRTVIIGTRTLR
jgi:hypothetical protein